LWWWVKPLDNSSLLSTSAYESFKNVIIFIKMNILVYGSNGWIGNQFKQILEKNNINYICGLSRVDNKITLLKEITYIIKIILINFI
jgi:hypothetical protein